MRIAESSPWGPKYDPIVGVLRPGEVHIMGGYNQFGFATREHWRAFVTPTSIEWERLPDMPFARAGATKAIEIAGRLHICGGNSVRYSVEHAKFPNDTWAWNGSKWRQMSASATWTGGMWGAPCRYDGKLWMLTRGDYATGNMGGAHYSEDCGATWVDASSVAPWPVSHADGYIVTAEHGIVLATGNNLGTNVYSLKRAA
jgi:hypothetical protein